MQTYSVRVDFTGQQAYCMLSTSWTPASTPCSNKLQILKLEDDKGNAHFASANFSGINPKSDKFLRINGNFGRSLGLKTGGELIVTEISQIPVQVTSAVVSCVCVDDWEILEANAEIVTTSLLNQLRVVYPGLKFPFWVTKSMTINLKIDKIEPEAEFGVLDSSSEIIIPSIANPANSNTISIKGLPRLRLHPITLFTSDSNYVVPSVSLLLNNIRHAFTYKAGLGELLTAEHIDDRNSYFFATIFELKNNKKECPGTLKVFLLDNLDVDESVLNKSFPLTNPPALYIHPVLAEIFQNSFSCKSTISLEQSTPQEFFETENKYSPIQFNDKNNSARSNLLFAGFEPLVEEGINFLKASLSIGNIRQGFVGPGFGNLLIQGKEGSGKTSLSSRLVAEFSEHPFHVHHEIVSCPMLRGKKSESVEKHLKAVLDRATKFQPSIVFLDDLDVLVPSIRTEQQNLAEEFQCLRVSEALLDCIFQFEGQQIVFIATVISTDTLNPYWRSRQGFHFFQKCVHIPPLYQEDRLKIFRLWIQYLTTAGPEKAMDLNMKIEPCDSDDYCETNDVKKLSNLSESMKESLKNIRDEFASPRMIKRIAEKWALQLFDNEKSEFLCSLDTHSDLQFKRIIMDEIENAGGPVEDAMHGKITWGQVGGLDVVKKELTKVLEWPIKYPKLFENSPVKLPSGILFYGFPGCGKTLLAMAIPSIVNAKFIHIKGPELLSKYIGASEQSVKDLFQRAKESKPCILFFDEFDSLVPRRGHDSTGVTDRVVNQFLAEMDGVEGGMGPKVSLIACTSRPDLIDPAILRPGRLDKHLFFPLPTKEERVEILKRQSEKLELSAWDDEDWDLIGRETEGFTGADLYSLLYSAQMGSIQEHLGKLQPNESSLAGNENPQMITARRSGPEQGIVITIEHMRNTLATFQPSLHGKELKKFQSIYEGFSSLRNGSSSEKRGSELTSMKGKRATLA